MRAFAEYHRHVLADSTGDALVELIDALTTNHTSFLRERAHFEFLARAANEEFREVCDAARVERGLLERRGALFDRHVPGGGFGAKRPARKFRILATDISTRVLDDGASAAFIRWDASTMYRKPWRRAHLLRGRGESKGFYKIKPAIGAAVEFARLNLIEPFAERGLFHVIFCRNVMMYFDQGDAAEYRAAAERMSGAGRLSFCGPLRVAHRRRACLGICAAGHLSQPEAGGRSRSCGGRSRAR